MQTAVSIRPRSADDRDAVLDVVRDAFSTNGRDGSEELEIVRATWVLRAAPAELDLVAVDGSELVGFALGARATINRREVIGLAPLCVAPLHQRQGTGKLLVQELLRRADAGGWPLVALLGSPAYYGALGFEPAGPLGIVYPPVGSGSPDFQVHRLAAYDASWQGDFKYCWEL